VSAQLRLVPKPPLLSRETAEQIRRWREDDRRNGIIWNDERIPSDSNGDER
jgi:hypothetical protein